jgi:hypothetical protein
VYQLHFGRVPDLDWEVIQEQMAAAENHRLALVAAEAAAKRAAQRKFNWRFIARVAIALGVLLLLLMIRQWYLGGRIPILREPEKFRVAPAPEEHGRPTP